MADTSSAGSSIWSNVGSVAAPLITGIGSGISASQTANANAEAAAGVTAAGANSAALLNPYAQSGTAAESQLLSLYGINGSPAQAAAKANFANTPGYAFTQAQGNQAIQRQASATGGEFSSATLGALSNYNTGLAQQTYQNYVNNLFGLVQPGASAASAAGNEGIQAATQAGKFTVGKGEANASGIQGASGAITNALQSPQVQSALSKLFGSGASASDVNSFLSSLNSTNPSLASDLNSPLSTYSSDTSASNALFGSGTGDPSAAYNPSLFTNPDSGSSLIDPSAFSASPATASSDAVGSAPSLDFSGYADTAAAAPAAAAPAAAAPAAAAPASASGLGTVAGGALAVAAPLAIAALGKESSPVGLSGQYIQGLEKGLQSPKGSASYNNAYYELASLLGDSNHNSNSALAALAQKYGVLSMAQLFPNISSPGGKLSASSIYGTTKLQ